MHNPSDHQQRLIRKLESIAPLSDEDKAAVMALPLKVKDLSADIDIVREGDRPIECCLMLTGFACRYKLTWEGKRQIMSFHVPGDIPDLQSLHIDVMDHSLGTLTPCQVAFISHEAICELTDSCPRIARAFWRDTLIDGAIFREWMVGIGRRSAHQRIAHLICELSVKLKAVGLAEDHTFELPITQTEIGDALGLSLVHTNRILQDLRSDRLIVWRGRGVQILDWEALKRAGEFDPAYLHMNPARAA